MKKASGTHSPCSDLSHDLKFDQLITKLPALLKPETKQNLNRSSAQPTLIAGFIAELIPSS